MFIAYDLQKSDGNWLGRTDEKDLLTAKAWLLFWDDGDQIMSYVFDKGKRILYIPSKYKSEYPKHSELIAAGIRVNHKCEVEEVIFYDQPEK